MARAAEASRAKRTPVHDGHTVLDFRLSALNRRRRFLSSDDDPPDSERQNGALVFALNKLYAVDAPYVAAEIAIVLAIVRRGFTKQPQPSLCQQCLRKPLGALAGVSMVNPTSGRPAIALVAQAHVPEQDLALSRYNDRRAESPELISFGS